MLGGVTAMVKSGAAWTLSSTVCVLMIGGTWDGSTAARNRTASRTENSFFITLSFVLFARAAAEYVGGLGAVLRPELRVYVPRVGPDGLLRAEERLGDLPVLEAPRQQCQDGQLRGRQGADFRLFGFRPLPISGGQLLLGPESQFGVAVFRPEMVFYLVPGHCIDECAERRPALKPGERDPEGELDFGDHVLRVLRVGDERPDAALDLRAVLHEGALEGARPLLHVRPHGHAAGMNSTTHQPPL